MLQHDVFRVIDEAHGDEVLPRLLHEPDAQAVRRLRPGRIGHRRAARRGEARGVGREVGEVRLEGTDVEEGVTHARREAEGEGERARCPD
ncbi:hypothetical protein RZS08_00520, partial [Arthrospira platensis SPKY1]|nr:hypothetical protein [Arthrospira platensis SPKY1]